MSQTNEITRPNLRTRLVSTARQTYHLGYTAFGGPPVHFNILHKRFVETQAWIDDQSYSELFAVCQALPGPASTKLLYSITLVHAGLLPALLALTVWCAPGALGMFGLSRGVANINAVLPAPVYALLSGLNAATVGLVALAGMQLSRRAISDRLSRTILIGTACAGVCYTALWYFPVLMVIGALLAIAWDGWGKRTVERIQEKRRGVPTELALESQAERSTPVSGELGGRRTPHVAAVSPQGADPVHAAAPSVNPIGVKAGIAIIAVFFSVFITLMVLRSTIRGPVELQLFTNLFLAGTIIFGGGPVVIPLLREYVVAEGWVTSRDFLIGLAIIQAFPGPNFNFAVFLSALASGSTSSPPAATALMGFFAIFSPGIILATGFQSIWRLIREFRLVRSALRGVNAAAVGLVWTAVYRLWEIGYLTEESTQGTSSGREPWWMVVAAVAFCGNEWYGIPPPLVIVLGGALGLARWGVLGRS